MTLDKIIKKFKDIGKKVDEIGKNQYEIAIPGALKGAKEFAKKGNASEMNYNLSLAENWARFSTNQNGKDISEQIDRIRKEGYETVLPVALRNAKKSAEEGEASRMEDHLFSVKISAGNIGKNIHKQVTKIEKKGYETAIPVALRNAKEYAKKGSAGGMERELLFAKRCAGNLGGDICEQVTRIRKEGYETAISIALGDAKKYAKKGDALSMEDSFLLAEKYAGNLGKDKRKQISEIERKGYEIAISIALKSAKEYAKKGHFPSMWFDLSSAKRLAGNLGKDILEQSSKIEKICYNQISER